MESITSKKNISKAIKNNQSDSKPVFETKAKLEVKESTYNRLVRIKLRIDNNKKTIDNRIKLLLDMRETYLDLFSYLRKFHPDVIGEYSNMRAIKPQGKDRFKDGYVSW